AAGKPEVLRKSGQAQAAVAVGVLFQELDGAVGGPVVDQDRLVRRIRGVAQDRIEARPDEWRAVVAHDEDGYQGKRLAGGAIDVLHAAGPGVGAGKVDAAAGQAGVVFGHGEVQLAG